jgi:hypothetical protein
MKKLFLLFLLSMFINSSCNQKGGKLDLNNGTLIYTEDVDSKVAHKLGSYLNEQGFFSDEKKSVKLDLKGDTWQFMMVLKEGAENDDQYSYLLGIFAKQLSRDVFNNEPVDIHICNNKLESLKVVNFKCDPPEKKPR